MNIMLTHDSPTKTLLSRTMPDEQVLGRRSCEFTNQSVFCISKTSVHLNKLQECLKDFQKKFIAHEAQVKFQADSKLLKFNEKKIISEAHKLEVINSGTALELFSNVDQEEPLKVTAINSTTVAKEEPVLQMSKKQIDMLHNVNSLITRLDESCSKLKNLLEKEKNRTKTLREKIDWHAYKRIHDLPAAVQQEHERCANNIQELKWHCAYQGRNEQRVQEKVRQAENINKRILEEIEFVNESSPLIKEKQQREKESTVVIQAKQDQTDLEVGEAREKLDDMERKFEQAKRQADHEEKFLAERLLSLSGELTNTLEKFLDSQNNYASMTETIARIENKLANNDLEADILDENLDNIKKKQKSLEAEVDGLNRNIFQETLEQQKLIDESIRLERLNAEQEPAYEDMIKTLGFETKEKTRELQMLAKYNKSSQKEIQNLKRRIDNSGKQKTADIKSVQRAAAERLAVEADLIIIKEETTETRLVYNKLLLSLDQEREKSIEIEDNLSLQVEALKKQNKEENHARMILQARINADSADFSRRKKEAERKKEKLLKGEQDVKNVVATVNAQVQKLEEKYQERVKAVEGLDRVLVQLTDKYVQLQETLTGKISELEPKELNLKEVLSDLGMKEKEMENVSLTLNKKLRDMASSSIVMNKLLLSHQNAIEELNEEIAELQIQLDSGQGLETTLRESLQEVQERSKAKEDKHALHMEARKQTLSDMKERVDIGLAENNKLAVVYVDLQNKHIDQKNLFISAYEKSLIAQDSLSDKESLCELHTRLHEALKCYYQLRGIQTKAGLSRFEDMTRKSNKKLIGIQTGLEVATKNISAFLSANNDSHKYLHVQHQIGKHPINQINRLKQSLHS